MKILHHYNEHHHTQSAQEIVPFILKFIRPNSVLDVGCGLSQWLKVFQDYGAQEILGIDGTHVNKENIYIDKANFINIDLNNPKQAKRIIGDRKFDLILCLEVAEHLKPDIADDFVHFLTTFSDNILFSAAIPNQTGENHFNEQPHAYWHNLFKKRGYIFLDIFRERFWNNPNVNWWYKQNMFLVVKADSHLGISQKIYNNNLYIHPDLFDIYVNSTKIISIKSLFYKSIEQLKKYFIN